ncbi:MAG: DUF6515 family protein [Ferruginibacter sp.]
MKTFKNAFRILSVLGLVLFLSADIYAQNYRGRRHGNYYGYRPRVSIGIGINPYRYHYRSIAKPRIVYHRPYRLPYRNHYGPAFGLRIGILPYGYKRIYIGGNPYYYANGIYYRPYSSGGYTVAPPPLGAVVKHLPPGAKVTVIDGQKYYVLGGTFYQASLASNKKVRYEVVGTDGVLNTTSPENIEEEQFQALSAPKNNMTSQPIEGTIATQLPAGSTAITINRQKYYLSPSGVYYEEVIDTDNKVSYKVAGGSSPEEMEDSDATGNP